MEEPDVERVIPVFHDRKEDGIGMGICIVVILAVASQSSQKYSLVFFVPFVYGQKNEPLLDSPCIRQGGHERAVYHVPSFPVVLLLHVKNLEDGSSGLAYGEAAEFGEDVRLGNPAGIAHGLYLQQDFLSHILIVEIHRQGILDREAATDVQGIELRTYQFEVAVNVHALGQFVPVVCCVADTGIDEEMEHLQMELAALADDVLIERHDVAVADSQSGGIELEIRLLFRRYPDTYVYRDVHERIQILKLVHVVENRDDVLPSRIGEIRYVLYVGRFLETVADDIQIPVDRPLVFEGFDEVQVEG